MTSTGSASSLRQGRHHYDPPPVIPHPSSGHSQSSYQGCLAYSASELAQRWSFPGQAPSCSWVHTESNSSSGGSGGSDASGGSPGRGTSNGSSGGSGTGGNGGYSGSNGGNDGGNGNENTGKEEGTDPDSGVGRDESNVDEVQGGNCPDDECDNDGGAGNSANASGEASHNGGSGSGGDGSGGNDQDGIVDSNGDAPNGDSEYDLVEDFDIESVGASVENDGAAAAAISFLTLTLILCVVVDSSVPRMKISGFGTCPSRASIQAME
jgi:hypothetical protein